MGIVVEFNPELALRHFDEYKKGNLNKINEYLLSN